MTELTVRAAGFADLEAMLDLYDHLNPPNPRPDDAAGVWRATLAHPGLTVFVGAVPSGDLVASCTLVVIPHLMRSGVPYALIEDVAESVRAAARHIEHPHDGSHTIVCGR